VTSLTIKRSVWLIIAVVLITVAVPGLKLFVEAITRETAYQLMVDGEVWVTVSRKDSLERMLKEYQKTYLTNIDKNARVKRIAFQQKVEIVEVKARPKEIETLEGAKKKIYAVEQKPVMIEVKSGDNFWDLSMAYHLKVGMLEILNPDMDPDKIFPGDKLVVKPVNPRLDVIIELENTIVESIPFKIEYRKDNTLYKNQKSLLKEGIEGQKEVLYHITLLNGYQSSLEVRGEKVLKNPVNAIVKIGTKTTVSRGGRVNYGVVSGKRISSLYGYRIHPITGRRLFHEGLDIAAAYGNGVYAYTDGRVVQAGWNGGYGNSILIDHGNGLRTRYGHLSKISVRVGQRVSTGQRIGSVGSSGSSTGPHLHFEVIKWGRTQNPLNYI
jgi:murein DD-endopeptidase MepM/ murein hydrolase activator NlpD